MSIEELPLDDFFFDFMFLLNKGCCTALLLSHGMFHSSFQVVS